MRFFKYSLVLIAIAYFVIINYAYAKHIESIDAFGDTVVDKIDSISSLHHSAILQFISSVSNSEQGKNILRSLAKKCRQEQKYVCEGLCYDKLSWFYYLNNNPSISIKYLGKARLLYEAENYYYGLGNINLALGLYESNNENYGRAEEYFNDALSYFNNRQVLETVDSLMIKSVIAITYLHLGDLKYSLKKYSEALDFYSLSEQKAIQDIVKINVNTGKAFARFDSGERRGAFEITQDLRKTYIDTNQLFKIYGLTSELHIKNEDYEKALAYIDSMMFLNGDNIRTNELLLKSYTSINKPDSVLKYYKLVQEYEKQQNKKMYTSAIDYFESQIKAEEYEKKYLQAQSEKLTYYNSIKNLIIGIIVLIIIVVVIILKTQKKVKDELIKNEAKSTMINDLKSTSQKMMSKNINNIEEIERLIKIGERPREDKVLSIRDQMLVKSMIKEVKTESSQVVLGEQELVKKMGIVFPQLSKQEVELLYLIYVGKSSYEIADYFGIENNSVFTKRYRLRKKINIDKGTDLNEFVTSKLPADN